MSEHLKSQLQYWTKTPASEVGLRVAALLDDWGGLHHFEEPAMKKVQWSHPLFIELKLSRFTSMGQLATFDFSELTRLVFLAHDHCIRVDIEPCNGTHLRLLFHPRPGRSGSMPLRHPTLEDAVAEWQRRGANRFVFAEHADAVPAS